MVEPAGMLRFKKNRVGTLTLRNFSAGYVAYKVKTSNPSLFVVRPSAGTLERCERVIVEIACADDGKTGPCDVKFLIQAAAAASSEEVSREWWCELNKDS